jgi:hypothetical protein
MDAAPVLRYSFRVTALVGPGTPLEHRGDETLEFIPITGRPVTGDIEGELVPGGDYFLTTPRFRTVSPGLAWLTRSVFVGRAQANPHATTIRVYEVLS